MVKNFLKKHKWWLLLLLVSLIPLKDLLHPGLFFAHDSPDHVARIANFYQNLKEGTLIPRWATNLNWGYGHPILMFLYPLPSYAASLFHLLGFSLVGATKIVFGLGFVLSGLAMYFWTRALFGELGGFVSGLLYMFAPYRFVDLYVRGAIGENFFFIWPPLVAYFLVKLAKKLKWRYLVGASFSLAAMILSHNALSIMFAPFILGYMALLLWQKDGKDFVTLLLCYFVTLLLCLSLSAFFWIPAFFEGKYTLRDIVTQGEWSNNFETLRRLFYSPWSYGGTGEFSVQLGIIQWLIMFTSPFIIYFLWKELSLKKKEKKSSLIASRTNLVLSLLSLTLFLSAIFLMLKVSQPVYERLTILQKFQFPWRFLSLAIFPPAILVGTFIYLLPKRLKSTATLIILLLSLCLSFRFWQAKGFLDRSESFYTSVYHGTTDTGESAPVWSVRFMEKEPEGFIEVVEGGAEIEIVERKIRRRRYKINVITDTARILENSLYFPGWFVYVDGRRKSLSDIWFQDPNYRGLINFYVPQGEHLVEVGFKETKLRQVADIISTGAVINLAFFSWVKFRWPSPLITRKKT